MIIKKNNQVEIVAVDNGYIIKQYILKKTKNGKNFYDTHNIAIEENHGSEKETIKRVLYQLSVLLFGIIEDKYSKENLNISFDKKGKKAE